MGLGINKDLEPLARRLKRLGGDVEVTHATHVIWRFPDGSVIRSGLTMNSHTAEYKRRELQAMMDRMEHGEPEHEVRPAGSKWHVVHKVTDQPITNGSGYPRTFSSQKEAEREVRKLHRLAQTSTRQQVDQ